MLNNVSKDIVRMRNKIRHPERPRNLLKKRKTETISLICLSVMRNTLHGVNRRLKTAWGKSVNLKPDGNYPE